MNKKNHMIDFLFPVALLFVFAVSAITVLLFATNIYEGEVEDSTRNNNARTSIAYVSEKVHQNGDGRITLSKLDGCDAIIIDKTIEGADYRTYVYVCDGELRELFTTADFPAAAELGTKIIDVNEFSITRINDKLIKIACTDQGGRHAQTFIGIKE